MGEEKPAGGNTSLGQNDKSAEREYTVEDAIEEIGFGRYQIFITLMAGFAWIADGMEIMVVTIIGPVLLCEWRITSLQEAFITTVVFCGMVFGSPIFGFIADKYGRRMSLLASSLWTFIFGVISAAVPSIYWLYVVRFLVGFGVGGGMQSTTYLSEFLPNKYRGKGIILIEVFWAIGGFLEVVLAIVILLPFGWRWWLACSATPSLVFSICCFWLPTSPHFDLIVGKEDKAQATLAKAARWNKVEVKPGKLIPKETVALGRFQDLWKSGYVLVSSLLCYLWFTQTFCFYGATLLATEIINKGTTCDPLGFEKTAEACSVLTMSEYKELLWTSSAELPGLVLTAILIDIPFMGRKRTLVLQNLLYAGLICLLCICMDGAPMVFLLFCARAVSGSMLQVMFVYTPEIYPTEVRAMSIGCGSALGKCGALLTPYVAQVLINVSLHYTLGVYAAVGFTSALCAFMLPYETLGKNMADKTKSVKPKTEDTELLTDR